LATFFVRMVNGGGTLGSFRNWTDRRWRATLKLTFDPKRLYSGCPLERQHFSEADTAVERQCPQFDILRRGGADVELARVVLALGVLLGAEGVDAVPRAVGANMSPLHHAG
jgi:hypothetical protein